MPWIILMFISSMSLIMASLTIFLKHPLSMGLTLLSQTLLTCLIVGSWSQTYWFSYILFLVMVGGLLVLFIYVISLASNEMFMFSVKTLMYLFFMGLTLMSILSLLYQMYAGDEMNYDTMTSDHSWTCEYSEMLMKLFNLPMCTVTLMLVIYLLITLIAVVKVTNLFYGPLRVMH